MRFFTVDEDYIQYLKKTDDRVPNMDYGDRIKFVCGPVMEVNGIQYYAPVSHKTKGYETSFLLYNNRNVVACLRLAFMIPADKSYLHRVQFNKIKETNPQYANLMEMEYRYIKKNRNAVTRKAEKVYRIGCSQTHFLHNVCCYFPALERAYLAKKAMNMGNHLQPHVEEQRDTDKEIGEE